MPVFRVRPSRQLDDIDKKFKAESIMRKAQHRLRSSRRETQTNLHEKFARRRGNSLRARLTRWVDALTPSEDQRQMAVRALDIHLWEHRLQEWRQKVGTTWARATRACLALSHLLPAKLAM